MADGIGIAGMQREDLVCSELGNTVAIRLEIVDEKDVLNRKGPRKIAHVQRPREVGKLEPTVAGSPLLLNAATAIATNPGSAWLYSEGAT